MDILFSSDIAPLAGVLALVWALVVLTKGLKHDEGTEEMKKIAHQVQQGAMAFLRTEYRILSVFVAIVFVVLYMSGLEGLGPNTAYAFLAGACASALAGWIGMFTATRAAVRTTHAAQTSLQKALQISFASGTVMGLTVVGLGVLGVAMFTTLYGPSGLQNVLGFSFGASSIALFARVGGGIFTKAADVGADLVGKVEAGIPEDDPRNPAVIADNVGDNVGDVAGMGADLFESYVGSIIATMILGVSIQGVGAEGAVPTLVALPLIVAGLGIIASLVGTFFVRTNDEHKLHTALFSGLVVASLVLVGLVWVAVDRMGDTLAFTMNGHAVTSMGIFKAIIVGLVSGVLIGKATEYYTSEKKGPAQGIAAQSETGAATNLIHGLATGMASVGLPVIFICIAIWMANDAANIYGIAIAAVGMLSTLGISLGVDAYGPVADNAGGVAEMAGLDPVVRQRTDALDACGNTTAAIGKGFAIGSAALTALALFAAFKQTAGLEAIDVTKAKVTIGLFLGGMLPFLFSAMTMRAVGRAATAMIEEVRRQFREIPGLLEGKADPDPEACVAIATKGSIGEMVVPGLLAILAPVAVGKFIGVEALGALLAGALTTGVMMAIFMANAGGAWDNAKKYIEGGAHGGKGSDAHKAAVVGDTVGDPFKDTSGPSLNILIKLMSIVALIFLPWFLN